MAVHNVVQNPAFALTPRAGVSPSPFTGGQELLQNVTRQQEIQKLFDAFAGNNQLRSVLAQRFAEMEQQNVRTRNLDKIGAFAGPSGALDIAGGTTGFRSNAFSQALDPVAFFQARADAQKTASEAANIGAQGGQLPLQNPLDQLTTGFQVAPVTPTSVAAAQAGGGGAKAEGYVNGVKITFDLGSREADLVGAVVARARNQPVGSTGIQLTPQAAKVQGFLEKASRNNPTKLYTASMRPDGIMVIHEIDQATGASEEVQHYNQQGEAVAGG